MEQIIYSLLLSTFHQNYCFYGRNNLKSKVSLSEPRFYYWISMKPSLFRISYQTVQLRNRTLIARLADIPDFDTPFSTSIHMSCWIAYGNSTHHFPMVQGIDLASMPRYSRSNESIWRERNWLHLAICSNVK